VIFVSSYNRLSAQNANQGFISKIGLDGQIIELNWATGLDGPCGMGLIGNKLYVAECTGNVVEIDADSGQILQRIEIPGARFLNDLAIGPDGSIYVSDTSPPLGFNSEIYRIRDGRVEHWLSGDEVYRVNGIFIHDGKMFFGGNPGMDGMFRPSISRRST